MKRTHLSFENENDRDSAVDEDRSGYPGRIGQSGSYNQECVDPQLWRSDSAWRGQMVLSAQQGNIAELARSSNSLTPILPPHETYK